MSALHQAKCFNHAGREAVARCPECRNFFCRECITEHGGRLVCAACLQKTGAEPGGEQKRPWRVAGALWGILKMVVGLLVAWLVYYTLGQILLMIPDSFHSGDIWGSV